WYQIFALQKPPRSRSSSASRNEVQFSSIPQLLSHPDDRFDADMSGEPFRSTSEHELTPHTEKAGSRLSVATALAVDEELPFKYLLIAIISIRLVRNIIKSHHQAGIDMHNGMLTVPVHSAPSSEIITAGNNPPSRTPSLKSLNTVPSPLIVTDALTPKRAPYELKEEDYNSPASFNRTLFTREAFQRRRHKEV
ncbi:unnamed protein product, partial [Strongylus vulgaris]